MTSSDKSELPAALHTVPPEQFLAFFTQADQSRVVRTLESANQALARRLFQELPTPVINKLMTSLPASAIGKLILHASGHTLEGYFKVASERASSALLKAVTSPRSRKKILTAIGAARQPSSAEHNSNYESLFGSRDGSRPRRPQGDFDSYISLLAKHLSEQQAEKLQYRIETKVPQFVTKAVAELDELRKKYEKKASRWATAGMLIMATAFFGVVALTLYGLAYGPTVTTWSDFAFVTFKGIVIATLLGFWAKHAFSVSSAYSHEAIKRSDRAHAINFGKLYLEIYGNEVDRAEVVRVFENWNLETDTAFAKVTEKGMDAALLTKFAELGIDLVKSSSKKGKDD